MIRIAETKNTILRKCYYGEITGEQASQALGIVDSIAGEMKQHPDGKYAGSKAEELEKELNTIIFT